MHLQTDGEFVAQQSMICPMRLALAALSILAIVGSGCISTFPGFSRVDSLTISGDSHVQDVSIRRHYHALYMERYSEETAVPCTVYIENTGAKSLPFYRVDEDNTLGPLGEEGWTNYVISELPVGDKVLLYEGNLNEFSISFPHTVTRATFRLHFTFREPIKSAVTLGLYGTFGSP